MKTWMVLAALCAAIPASAGTLGYNVAIDTSSISGSAGSLFFFFGPGDSPFDPATATVSSFTGGALGAGTLPLPLVLDNTAFPGTYQQDFTYGSSIHFLLMFDGPAVNAPSPGAVGGSVFGLFLLDDSDNALLTDSDTGAVFTASIEAATGAVSDETYTNQGGRSVVNATPVSAAAVPEPASGLLLASGAAILAVFARRARAR